MKKLGTPGLTVVLLALLSGPASAAYRQDCASVGSWFGHVRAAIGHLAGAAINASLPDITKEAISGELNTADGASVAFTLVGQSLAAHINPLAAFDLGAALVCFPNSDDGVNP